ncbi:hypothetical protein Cylst_3695 [Cylindrospermum stagnale PCC 7417]|uniref:Uncharacterized protein n=1 Tax=Cylindrospermum stagnale PCC 7417 TaxID=56107 RepID=K9X176_9NOST|nr:hypothetical protein Cylst_3695 [Cylindrospermum stagnale PCC 7417]
MEKPNLKFKNPKLDAPGIISGDNLNSQILNSMIDWTGDTIVPSLKCDIKLIKREPELVICYVTKPRRPVVFI